VTPRLQLMRSDNTLLAVFTRVVRRQSIS